MKQVIPHPKDYVSRIAMVGVLVAALVASTPIVVAQSSSLIPMQAIMWHGIAGPQGKYSGAISDVLVEMPTGRVRFVAVNPAELFQQQRVLPPDAVSRLPSGDFRSQLSLDQWLRTPVLDMTGQRVEQFNGQVDQVLAVQAPEWTPGHETPRRGRRSVEWSGALSGYPQFVSLQSLTGAAAGTSGHEELGTVSGFVADWANHVIRYAIVTARNTPAAPNAPGFAVPLALLAPGAGGQQVVVNVTPDAFRGAPQLSLNQAATLRNPEQIFRLPSTAGLARAVR